LVIDTMRAEGVCHLREVLVRSCWLPCLAIPHVAELKALIATEESDYLIVSATQSRSVLPVIDLTAALGTLFANEHGTQMLNIVMLLTHSRFHLLDPWHGRVLVSTYPIDIKVDTKMAWQKYGASRCGVTLNMSWAMGHDGGVLRMPRRPHAFLEAVGWQTVFVVLSVGNKVAVVRHDVDGDGFEIAAMPAKPAPETVNPRD
jgi:hypothetical protein